MEKYFNLFKVKFEYMDKLLLESNIITKDDQSVAIHINVESILRRMMNVYTENMFRVKDDERVIQFISSLINIASHYRLYFTKYKKYCKIYFYAPSVGNFNYTLQDINMTYRLDSSELMFDSVINKALQNTISSAIPLIKTILEYVEGVYYIESINMEPSLIPYILYNKDKDTKHIILSSDTYDYQYVIYDNVYVLRAKRENSYILYKGNVIDILKLENKLSNNISVNYNTVPFILSILGSPIRSIPKIKGMGLGTILKNIKKGVDNNDISDSVNNVFILSKILKDDIVEQVMQNYLCTDVESQYKMLMKSDFYNIDSQLIDKFDNIQLKKMNSLYFSMFPIQLNYLTSTISFKPKEKLKF